MLRQCKAAACRKALCLSKADNAAMATDMTSKTGSDYVGQANYAGVAQSVEHLTRNEKVTCSSHATSSKTSLAPVSGACNHIKMVMI